MIYSIELVSGVQQSDSVIQFSSVARSCLTLCDPMNCSTPGLPVHHQLPEFTQTHLHWVGDAIHTSHPLSSPSPPAFNLSQYQGLFKWVSSSHQVAKVFIMKWQQQKPEHHGITWDCYWRQFLWIWSSCMWAGKKLLMKPLKFRHCLLCSLT